MKEFNALKVDFNEVREDLEQIKDSFPKNQPEIRV